MELFVKNLLWKNNVRKIKEILSNGEDGKYWMELEIFTDFKVCVYKL